MTLSSQPTDNYINANTDANANQQRLVKNDVLFQCIEQLQGDRPFGSFLDAGTGLHSTRWIMALLLQQQQQQQRYDPPPNNSEDHCTAASTTAPSSGLTAFTAVTADETMRKTVQREVDALLSSGTAENSSGSTIVPEVVIGNWFPEEETATNGNAKIAYPIPVDRQYDTILADYLIGAMDGFSPYRQEEMFDILAQHLRPGGRLYIVGLEPLPDTTNYNRNNMEAENLLARVRQVRDACILLAGHRCYREFPMTWIVRQIMNNSNNNFQLIATKQFPIMYRHETIVRQINVGRSKLPYMPTKELKASMGRVLDQLEQDSLRITSKAPGNRIQVGFDYVVAAERRQEDAMAAVNTHDNNIDDEQMITSS